MIIFLFFFVIIFTTCSVWFSFYLFTPTHVQHIWYIYTRPILYVNTSSGHSIMFGTFVWSMSQIGHFLFFFIIIFTTSHVWFFHCLFTPVYPQLIIYNYTWPIIYVNTSPIHSIMFTTFVQSMSQNDYFFIFFVIFDTTCHVWFFHCLFTPTYPQHIWYIYTRHIIYINTSPEHSIMFGTFIQSISKNNHVLFFFHQIITSWETPFSRWTNHPRVSYTNQFIIKYQLTM